MQCFNVFIIMKPTFMEFWTQHKFYFDGLEDQTFYQQTGEPPNLF